MVVLPSTGASRYHNCCIDGGTRPEYFGHTLVISFSSDFEFCLPVFHVLLPLSSDSIFLQVSLVRLHNLIKAPYFHTADTNSLIVLKKQYISNIHVLTSRTYAVFV
jgi:hypothetical protein